MKLDDLRNIDQLCDFLEGTQNVVLLVEVDCLRDTANGLAAKKLCERA